ncbi:MAG: nucleotidyltransferase family protein [Clostridia bacterium]|nr:nucleotidyltransferase family protein [Clostridia bacterium]
MEEKELLKYGKYLTSLISSVILNTAAPAPFDDINWVKFFNLAKKHDSVTIVYSAIETMNIPDDAKTLFTKEKNKIVARTTRQAIEAERVFKTLEDNNIKYIKLKGIHIKDHYPAPYMRVFSDVDIYVSKEDREKAKSIMKDLGYKLKSTIDYHDEYGKDDFYIYEIHNPITPESSFDHVVFLNPFTKAISLSQNNLSCVLNNEHFYLHLFFHLYSHFRDRGCGIRFFTDLLVFQQFIKNTDYQFVEDTLKQHNMLDFYNSVQKLMGYFFFDEVADENTLTVAEFILKNKTIETSKNRFANLNFLEKFKYLLKIWFPPAKELAFRYPVLNKAPVLLPVCWVRRFFYSLFFKRSAFKQQTDNIKNLNSKKFKDIRKVRKLATKNNIK